MRVPRQPAPRPPEPTRADKAPPTDRGAGAKVGTQSFSQPLKDAQRSLGDLPVERPLHQTAVCILMAWVFVQHLLPHAAGIQQPKLQSPQPAACASAVN